MPFGHYGWVEHNATANDLDSFMDRRDLLDYAQPFRDLIDRPNVFDPILELMGPNIVLSMSQAIVRASTTEFPGFIHTGRRSGASADSGNRDQQAAGCEGPLPSHRCRGDG